MWINTHTHTHTRARARAGSQGRHHWALRHSRTVTDGLLKDVSEWVQVAQSCLTLCNPMDCSHQAPLSMEFSRQEYWSGLLFPSLGDLPHPGIKPRSPPLQADSLPSEPPGKYLRISTSLKETEVHIWPSQWHRHLTTWNIVFSLWGRISSLICSLKKGKKIKIRL